MVREVPTEQETWTLSRLDCSRSSQNEGPACRRVGLHIRCQRIISNKRIFLLAHAPPMPRAHSTEYMHQPYPPAYFRSLQGCLLIHEVQKKKKKAPAGTSATEKPIPTSSDNQGQAWPGGGSSFSRTTRIPRHPSSTGQLSLGRANEWLVETCGLRVHAVRGLVGGRHVQPFEGKAWTRGGLKVPRRRGT